MNFISRIADKISRWNAPISSWFEVSFDENLVHLSAHPPGKDKWKQSFEWSMVIRVIWQGEGGQLSDGIYFFTSEREESYVVPVDSKGGEALMNELIQKGYFSSESFTQAALDPYGIFCWPDDEKST